MAKTNAIEDFIRSVVVPEKKNKKIGLFFGSFNPVHAGHLMIANFMAEFTDLDEVWMVISPQNPFKQKKNLLADHHRYYLVNMAVEDCRKIRASNAEFDMPKPSYTIHTLTYLKEKYPEHKFVLIMGSDNLPNFPKWKNVEQIIEHYQIYVYTRPGNHTNPYPGHPKFIFVEAPLLEVSSTFIREGIKNKKDIRFFLTEKVYDYIQEMNFYK